MELLPFLPEEEPILQGLISAGSQRDQVIHGEDVVDVHGIGVAVEGQGYGALASCHWRGRKSPSCMHCVLMHGVRPDGPWYRS